MTTSDIIKIFYNLHERGFNLGLDELIDACKIININKKVISSQHVKDYIGLLWCNSLNERIEFDLLWDDLIANNQEHEKRASSSDYMKKDNSPKEKELNKNFPDEINSQTSLKNIQTHQIFQPIPIKIPNIDLFQRRNSLLANYSPITRRNMSYSWRYLTRWIYDGPADLLDIDSTIELVSKKGAFCKLIWKRRRNNHARLIFLVDRNGSMVPFHRHVEDMVETALYGGGLKEVNVYYFQNIFTEFLYSDNNLTKKVLVESVLDEIDSETSVLVLSDAGAAKGNMSFKRIHQTHEMSIKIISRTPYLAWINPMPEERWLGSSASVISQLIQMFQMDADGLSNAIDVLRGLTKT